MLIRPLKMILNLPCTKFSLTQLKLLTGFSGCGKFIFGGITGAPIIGGIGAPPGPGGGGGGGGMP